MPGEPGIRALVRFSEAERGRADGLEARRESDAQPGRGKPFEQQAASVAAFVGRGNADDQ
jgi:hypothetical protein